MIFNSIEIIICALIIFLLILVGKLIQRYSIYRDTRTDYHILVGEEPIDHITQDKLMKYHGTLSYNNYFDHTLLSMKKAGDEKIVFAGLCQDHGKKALKMWMPILKKWGGYFKDHRIIMVENDSMDETREDLLQEAEKNERLVVLCDADKPENTKTCKLGLRSVKKGGDKEKDLEKRIGVLAGFREVYWDYILKKYNDYDYMCVIDWDLEGDVSTSGFFHGLYYARDHADVIACNSYHKMQGVYFIHDTYPLLNHYRCDYLKENKTHEDIRVKIQMRSKLLYGSAYPVPVESAFGGIALYNIQNIRDKDAHYTNTPTCPIECEHTTFHKNLRVYIDPWMTFYITRNHH